MWLIKFFSSRLKFLYTVISLILFGVVANLDFLTGSDLYFAIFYMVPIFIATWFVGRYLGILLSYFSAVVWFIDDAIAPRPYANSFIPLWNITLKLAFFLIIVYVLAALKRALKSIQVLSKNDTLTGLTNRELFFELAHKELYRMRRHKHPFTFVYIDIDNLKEINEKFGHSAADLLLRTLAGTIKKESRFSDILARLGDDEFGLILQETNHESAQAVVTRIKNSIDNLMQKNNWPVTFSIGVLTFIIPPKSVDEVINKAEKIVFSIKNEGGNNVKFELYGA